MVHYLKGGDEGAVSIWIEVSDRHVSLEHVYEGI